MKELYRGLSQWLGGKPSQHSLPALGGREIDVLKVLWQHGELSAQEVLTFFAHETTPTKFLAIENQIGQIFS